MITDTHTFATRGPDGHCFSWGEELASNNGVMNLLLKGMVETLFAQNVPLEHTVQLLHIRTPRVLLSPDRGAKILDAGNQHEPIPTQTLLTRLLMSYTKSS